MLGSKILNLHVTLALFCVLGLFLLSTNTVFAKGKKPYKATNVDECIQEKECVWYAFSKMARLVDNRGRPYLKIHKWKEPLNFQLIGDYKEFASDVEKYMQEMKLHVPMDIGMESSELPNVKIFFGNDTEQSYSEILPNLKLLSAMGKRREHMDIKTDGKSFPDCSQERITDPQNNELIAIALFVDVSRESAQYCSHLAFYNSMGLSGIYIAGHVVNPFSIFSSETNAELTKLDILLLQILYSPEIRSGMDYKEVKEVFASAYKKSIEKTSQSMGDIK